MADEPDEMQDIERLVRVPSVLDGRAGYDVAPDGRTAAVAWNKSGQWELYLVSLDGDRLPRRITSADVPEGKIALHWSPDGRLAYGVNKVLLLDPCLHDAPICSANWSW
jgi:WD40-like Beta Propeller Repeat